MNFNWIKFKMALIVKNFEKNVWFVLTQGKAHADDNHRLLLCHDNGSLWYDYHTIDIIAHH